MRRKILFLFVGVALLFLGFKYFPKHCDCDPELPTATIGSTKINLIITDTPALREQGLSGDSLPKDTGMLFIFPTPEVIGFWMKDMKFDLDLIWIDSQNQIIGVEKDISRETYPKTFWPSRAVKYVLEVPAGFAQGHGIDSGEMVYLEL